MSGKRSFVELTDTDQDSVEIATTAKGDITFKVKCYGFDEVRAGVKATQLFESLQDWKNDQQPKGD